SPAYVRVSAKARVNGSARMLIRRERGEALTQIKCGGATGSLATTASGHDPPHPRSLARGSRLQAMYLGELREADRISLPPSTQLTVPALSDANLVVSGARR